MAQSMRKEEEEEDERRKEKKRRVKVCTWKLVTPEIALVAHSRWLSK